jgi:hypothetical protein
MKTRSIRSRLDDLERGSNSRNIIIVVRCEDETLEQAIEREVSAAGSLKMTGPLVLWWCSMTRILRFRRGDGHEKHSEQACRSRTWQ